VLLSIAAVLDVGTALGFKGRRCATLNVSADAASCSLIQPTMTSLLFGHMPLSMRPGLGAGSGARLLDLSCCLRRIAERRADSR
jgi:hypothetical protein